MFKERQKNPEMLQSRGPIFKALEVIFLKIYVTFFELQS